MLLFCIEIAHSKMKVIDNIVELQNELFEVRKEGKSIGLVPTMGALHEGHASLVRRSVKENDITVVSVFLNPTQFNDKGDLERYPRTLDHDCTLMDECGADIVFAPSVKEMYPTPDTRKFEFPPVTTVKEHTVQDTSTVYARLFHASFISSPPTVRTSAKKTGSR